MPNKRPYNGDAEASPHYHPQSSKMQKTHHSPQQNNRNAGSNGTHTHHKNQTNHRNRNTHPQIVPVSILDLKHPSTAPYPPVTAYTTPSPLPLPTVISALTTPTLPSLPPLKPGPLSTASFTHASVLDTKYIASSTTAASETPTQSYERLEFLGDAYLEIIATRLIFSRFPHLSVGRQAQLREKLVRNSTLAVFSRAYGFPARVRFAGQKMEGEKVQADVFEAFVAAVVLSWPEAGRGFELVEAWLTSLWAGVLVGEGVEDAGGVVERLGRGVVNRKDELVRCVGGKGVEIEYETIPDDNGGGGDDHHQEKSVYGKKNKSKPSEADHASQTFRIGVFLTGWGYTKKILGTGVGIGKKEASMVAVQDAFERNGEFIREVQEVKRRADEERRGRTGGGEGGGDGAVEGTAVDIGTKGEEKEIVGGQVEISAEEE